MPYTIYRQQPVSEQTLAQAELQQYINQQAQAVAPEELTTVEVHSHHFEIFAGKELIAYITYDHSDFITQRWVVMVLGNEIFRHNTIARCLRYVEWHHKDGSLPAPLPSPAEYPKVPTVVEICFSDQELIANGELVASVEFDNDNHADLYWRVVVNGSEIYRDTTPARCQSYVKQAYQQGMLPVQRQEEPCTTGNEIMAQIFDACEQHGLELLDDGIYTSDGEKLGEVGFTDGEWWLIRASSVGQQKATCESAIALVRSLLQAEAVDWDELLDKAFDELTADEWLLMMESEAVRELIAA
ncbi:hypothetical protein NOS3756_58320 (plasmid) [Nostoc sp. NIES-3756]|uniref:hypothetical protein n=1 Tax=Nostoc sp. NIES-3756 TaxID=1751286 RepID=UPI00071FDAB2|nr:hypothetical protein [Nostoc sp. NIES-3756]BAT56820.1 hypothetical protein NOS3756_58320 [Nostoc sp. NIES-3756]